jgi:hypothetical protein
MFPKSQHVRWQLVSGICMESVLLGLAAPAAAGTAGSLLERTLQTAVEPFAGLLHAISSAMSPEGDASVPVTIDSLHGNLASLRSELATQIEEALTSAGIDLSEPITLRFSEANGQLEVVGVHPQKTLIEAALADNPDLAENFAGVAALQQLLAAADKLGGPDGGEIVPFAATEQDAVTALFTKDDDGATLEFS